MQTYVNYWRSRSEIFQDFNLDIATFEKEAYEDAIWRRENPEEPPSVMDLMEASVLSDNTSVTKLSILWG